MKTAKLAASARCVNIAQMINSCACRLIDNINENQANFWSYRKNRKNA